MKADEQSSANKELNSANKIAPSEGFKIKEIVVENVENNTVIEVTESSVE